MGKGGWTANRIARYVGLALLVGGCIFVLVWEPAAEPVVKPRVIRPAKLYEVRTVGEAVARSYAGVVKAAAEVDLSFRVAGPLVKLPIQRGQEVQAGDLIAQIDPRDFETRLASVTSALEEAQARLAAMKAGEREEVILRIENKVRAAKADLENAEIELGRYQKLLDEQVVSQSEFDAVKLRRDTAQEAMAAAEQELAQAKKGARQEDIDAQEATIRGLQAQRLEAENALADTNLVAPFAGLIAKQFVENFQEVRAKEPIVSLQDVSHVEVVADIPEAVVAVVSRELVDKLVVTFASLPGRSFEAEFKEMETEADARTRTYAVTVMMPAPQDVHLLKGMPAELHVTLKAQAPQEEGVLVPVTAVFSDASGNPHVWTARPAAGADGVFDVKEVAVEVGMMSGSQLVVTAGLKGGETIVSAGVHFLDAESQVTRLAPQD